MAIGAVSHDEGSSNQLPEFNAVRNITHLAQLFCASILWDGT